MSTSSPGLRVQAPAHPNGGKITSCSAGMREGAGNVKKPQRQTSADHLVESLSRIAEEANLALAQVDGECLDARLSPRQQDYLREALLGKDDEVAESIRRLLERGKPHLRVVPDQRRAEEPAGQDDDPTTNAFWYGSSTRIGQVRIGLAGLAKQLIRRTCGITPSRPGDGHRVPNPREENHGEEEGRQTAPA